MNKTSIALLLALAGAAVAPVQAADVGVSVTVGQPGFYGHIDIGDFPQPAVIYRQPMIIERGHEEGPPMYLRVPPGHAKHWNKHCAAYNACGRPVYFVRDNWYNNVYVPQYRQRHGGEQGNGGRDDRRDEGRDGDHGRGEGRGNGHGKGHGHGHD